MLFSKDLRKFELHGRDKCEAVSSMIIELTRNQIYRGKGLNN